MRDRRTVFDRLNVESGGLKCSDGAFPTAAWTVDADIDFLHSELNSLFSGLLSGHLTGERRAFSTALKAAATRARRTKRVALGIRNRDRRVVKRRLNVSNAHRNIPSDLSFLYLSHRVSTPTSNECLPWSQLTESTNASL